MSGAILPATLVSAGVALATALAALVIGLPLGLLGARGLRPLTGAVPALFIVLLALGGADMLTGLQLGAADRVAVLIGVMALTAWPGVAQAAAEAADRARRSDAVLAARVNGRGAGAQIGRRALAAACAETVGVAARALVLEATVSFLGLGAPGSLGALIRSENDLFQAERWWSLAAPCAALAVLVLMVRLLWLRVAPA